MFDLIFNTNEFVDAINELVPSYQRKSIIDIAQDENSIEFDFDKFGMMLTGEENKIGIIVPTGAPSDSVNSMWGAIKAEVFDYICTTSRKYSVERKEAGVTIKNVITIIATAIASSFHIAVGVITGAVTIALMSVLKVGKNAWCAVNKPQ
ncbi:hypothetical protein [Vibrio crassostreae]|uniref:hypothetical protein n=1 Tax=Vibrio crassostreae TaxID=246167 RepID=UPI001B3150F7|nr:hypothetical protein [Vibrio crassostreae]